MSGDLINLAALLGVVLLINWTLGKKIAYYFLLLIVLGVVFAKVDQVQTLMKKAGAK